MLHLKIKVCLLLTVAACTEEATGLTIPYQVPPSSSAWLDVPWPSDLRLNEQGQPKLFSYPDPQAAELVRAAIALAETRDGFALQPTIYIEMGALVAAEQLDVDPEVALEAGAAVQLVALDGALARRPLALGQGGADDWLSETVLHARPLFGWPLQPNQRYALVVTSALKARNGEAFNPVESVAEGLRGRGPQAPYLEPLRNRLSDYALQASDIVVATVFTTADPGREMRALTAAQNALESPSLTSEWRAGEAPLPRVYEAEYLAPLWQHGVKPYGASGGGFLFTDEVPQIATRDERMRVAVMVPRAEPPERGWPVVIYQHGTGGSHRSFLSGAGSYAQDLTDSGLAMIGLDQPLHGERAAPGTNTEWHTFNPFNLEASAANLRQGALDMILLHRMLREGKLNSREPRISFDPERIYFFGHSQGGLTGSLALPHVANLPCSVLSGAGAALSMTLLERKDPLDIAEALKGWGGAQGPLFPSHPMISLVQHAFEPSDPISAAPNWQNSGPHHLLITSGQLDQQTPFKTGDAMAMAGLVPQIEPIDHDLWRHELESIRPSSGRLVNNAQYPQHSVTAAYRQSRSGDHFVVFESNPVRRMVRSFFTSCAAGEPVLSSR